MTPRRAPLVSMSLAVLLLAAADADAQSKSPGDATFNPQLFHPAVGPDEFVTVEPAAPLLHLNYSLGLWFNYSRGSFAVSNVVCDSGGGNCQVKDGRADVIRNALAADLVFSLGIIDRLQIGLGIPATLYQDGDDSFKATDGTPYTLARSGAFALGDPWLDVKVRIFGHERGPQVAAAAMLSVPASLATSKNFGGDSGVTVGGKALAGWESERWRAGLTLGVIWHQHESHYFSTTVGKQLHYGAAFAFDAIPQRRLAVVGEVYGHSDFAGTSISNIDANPLEFDVAAKLRFLRSFYGTLGVGTGVVRGLGAPLVRVFAGVTFSPDRRDRDHDGVPDVDDKCPDLPEDRDGFQDDDGCPDPDNDGDGIPDAKDKCPNEAEDFDGFQDDDGCPEYDNDKDGIPDIRDACPMDPEDGKPPKPNDGCPLDKTDSDGDGIPDNKDKCPTEPEDKDGFQDEDGCPDVDNDEDGIPDQYDKCPNEPEDKDGFEDEDGCPDPDNDHDGILDKDDKCPNEPETINGYKDEDGCPDSGPPPKVQIVGEEIVILEKVFFDTARASIQKRSFNLLDQLASTVKAHPEIKKIQIEGHTDSQGRGEKNRKLSQERADSVRFYLIKRGINAFRLEAKGFGAERPVADNKTAKGREANRRVEFHILEQDKKTEPTPDTVPPPSPE